MREPRGRDRLIQIACAAILLLPILATFASGGLGDASAAAAETAERSGALVTAAGRSLAVGALAVALALAIGIPAGWALASSHSAFSSKGRGKTTALLLAALPLALPASVAVSGWVGQLAPAGAASRFNVPIQGFEPASRGWLFGIIGAAFVLGTTLWPIVAFESWPAFRRARNSEAYEAALLYGSRARSFFGIALPQARGEIAAGASLVFLLAASDFSVTSLLLVRSLPVEIHDALSAGKTAAAAWTALPLLVMAFAAAWTLQGRKHPSPCPLPQGERENNGGAPLAKAILLGGVVLGFGVPMLACLYEALHGRQPMSRVFGAGSDALLVSLRLAGAAALLAALAGVLRLVFWAETRARPLNAAGLFLLAVPGSFVAAALLSLQLHLQGAAKGLQAENLAAALPAAVLTLGFVARFLYLPLRLVEEGLAALDPDLLDAAALAGHGRLARGITIALPLAARHIAAAAALVFILALGEVALADKLHPPGLTPATVWLFQQQHLGYDEAVFGLSLLLGAVAAGALAAAGVAARVLGKLVDRPGVTPV